MVTVKPHGPLVRLVPVHRSGRIVHPERLTIAEDGDKP